MRIDYNQLEFIDPILRAMMKDLQEWLSDEPLITSLYRIGDTGIHGTLPLRATDIRCKSDFLGGETEKYLNNRWIYDPSRPDMKVCMYHDVGRGAHIHLQVHPNTIHSGKA